MKIQLKKTRNKMVKSLKNKNYSVNYLLKLNITFNNFL